MASHPRLWQRPKVLSHVTKILLVAFLFISTSMYAKEIEHLKEFVKRKPLFLSDKTDTVSIASRCSALYLVLSSRTESPKSKELQAVSQEYAARAYTYDQVREVISKVTGSSKAMQKEFIMYYADITLLNWKENGDLFKGVVGEDLDVCSHNYADFKKLANHLSKEIKK